MATLQSQHPHKRQTQGFTLLEMTVVLAIISIVSVSLVTAFSAGLRGLQYKQTVAKMEAIQKALYEYRLAFSRLPCPADATITISTLNFGVAAANPGACTGGAPAANFSQSPAVGAQDVREGMIPVKTLQLPDDYAFDGWGRRFMYAVSKDMTQMGAFNIISTYDMSTRMTIKDAQGNAKSTIICEALISFGPDGHGAYPRNGGATRINASSVNTSELDNCDCDSSAAATGVDGVCVQKDPTSNPANKLDNFDDLVYITSRGDYILPSSILAQPFNINAGGGANTNPTTGGGAGGASGGGGTISGGITCAGVAPNCGSSSGSLKCVCVY